MGAVFELLHQNGTKKPEILELMANLKFTPNMQRLLEEAQTKVGPNSWEPSLNFCTR